jgi:hypothetical protein
VVLGNRISLRKALAAMPEIPVTGPLARRVRNGYQPSLGDLSVTGRKTPNWGGEHAKLITDDKLVAIVRMERKERKSSEDVKVIRVFL